MSEYTLVTPLWVDPECPGYARYKVGDTYWLLKRKVEDDGVWLTVVDSIGDIEDFSPEDRKHIHFEFTEEWNRALGNQQESRA